MYESYSVVIERKTPLFECMVTMVVDKGRLAGAGVVHTGCTRRALGAGHRARAHVCLQCTPIFTSLQLVTFQESVRVLST